MKIAKGWAFPDADEQMVAELSEDGRYQSTHLDAAMRYVKTHSVCIDGGAHVGTWSKRLSPLFKRVIAVEPSPDTFEALAANMQTFGCANVELVHAALGAKSGGFVSMALAPAAVALKNTGARYAVPTADAAIPVIRIDDWNLSSLGFLKLDVEGSEPMALAGASQTITRCRPIILFENKWLWVRHFGVPKHAVEVLLTRHGYHKLLQISHDQIWGPVVQR